MVVLQYPVETCAPERASGPTDTELPRPQTLQVRRDQLARGPQGEHCGADLLLLKGIVNLVESPDRPAVIHGVQHVFHAPAWLERWPSDDRRSRIVFITRRIPRRWIEVLLDAIGAEVTDVDGLRN